MINLFKILFQQLLTGRGLFYLILSAGPTLIWLSLCLWLDRKRSEPKKEILKIFFWGAFITLPIILVAAPLTQYFEEKLAFSFLLQILVLSFLVDAFWEELAKLGILGRLYRSKHFDELRDGFIYGMILGLGLAFIENVFYALLASNLAIGGLMILLRGITATLIHFLAGGIIGYYIAVAKFYCPKKKQKAFTIFKGFFLALLLHGFYNTVIRFGWSWGWLIVAVLLIFVFSQILRKIHQINKTSRLNPK